MVSIAGVPATRGSQGVRARYAAVALAVGTSLSIAQAQQSALIEDLSNMSLEQLGNVQVTSVSKSPELLRKAPAAIYVITHDEIVRSGATSLPQVLRLAPNLLVTQLTASNYVAAARGLGGNPDAQNFANKLLMLIDGRSVYSPLYSGIYHDAQDVILDDIDRIEVISGPGATLWGANAMNGVINIITRPAYLTDGTLVTAATGNLEQNLSARYGGKIDEELTYRFYGKAFQRDAMQLADGADAQDDWYKGQGGFRLDWSHGADLLTVQGDAYRGLESQQVGSKLSLVGANALARWQHHSERSDLQLQTYYDFTQRTAPADGVAFDLHTYDIEIQQSIALGSMHKIVWGAGERINSYRITSVGGLLFVPNERDLTLGNVFAQDTLALSDSFKLTLGVKLEDNPYSGWETQPDVRLAWQVSDGTLLWAAASRAIRSATPFDQDVVERLGGVDFLIGNAHFRPEEVTAYEIGYRGDPTATFSVSISSFYNDYDDLRTIEPTPTTFIPLHWDNSMRGFTYGVTAWAKWQVTDWWRLSPGFTALHKRLKFAPGASGLLGVAQAGNDPSSHASLTSSMDLPHHLTFDASLRYVGALPDPALQEYYDLTARLGWRVSQALEISLTGFNLLDATHAEYPADNGEEIKRSVIAEARWRFQ